MHFFSHADGQTAVGNLSLFGAPLMLGALGLFFENPNKLHVHELSAHFASPANLASDIDGKGCTDGLEESAA